MDRPAQNGPGGINSSNAMNRAEKFEDEKRRIVDSCFSKKDPDGACMRRRPPLVQTFVIAGKLD